MTALLFPLLPLADIPPPQPYQSSPQVVTLLVFLALTLALELPLYALAWKWRRTAVDWRRWMGAALVANLISHPIASLVWAACPRWSFAGTMAAFLAVEAAVLAFEAAFLRWRTRSRWSDALIAATLANVVSGAVGAALNFLR